MPIHFPAMKQIKINHSLLFYLSACCIVVTCTNSHSTEKIHKEYDDDVLNSVLLSADSLATFPFVQARVNEIKTALANPRPILLCKDSLSKDQAIAQLIALNDSVFTRFLKDPVSKLPYRNEIFGVYPARQSDMTTVKTSYNLPATYRVEMYNYALNNTSIALVDVQQQKVIGSYTSANSQPDISAYLKSIAIKIAIESPEVQKALGVKPEGQH
jgi:hypothetical protein